MAALKNFVLMDVNKARTLSYPTIDIAIISMTGVVRYSFLMYKKPMSPRDFTFYQKRMYSMNKHTRSHECLETILV